GSPVTRIWILFGPAIATSIAPRMVQRFRRWSQAARELPPSPWEVAAAPVVGAALVAFVNGVASVAAVRWPGAALRLSHRLHAAREIVGAAAWVAALPALAGIAATRFTALRRPGPVVGAWLAW